MLWLYPEFTIESPWTEFLGEDEVQIALLAMGKLKPLLRLGAQILFLVRGDGRLGFSGSGTSMLGQALSGLAKTLEAEWPGIHGKVLDLHPELQIDDANLLLWQEWHNANLSLNQVGVDTDLRRWGLERQYLDLSLPPEAKNPDSPLWLVSGGARGVTATCVIALANQQPGTFVLLGRSKLEQEPDWALGVIPDELTKAASEHLKQQKEKPVPKKVEQLKRAVLATREIQHTLQQLEATGSNAFYLSVYINNAEGLHQALQPILEKHGPIRGLIHGAGVLADRKLEQKTAADFQQVFGTKLHGLRGLWQVLDPSQLRHILLFSSAAGFFGNAGQSDYAIANESLNQVAHQLQQQLTDCRVVAYNWGPWDGGMVTPGLRALFEDRGVQVITPEVGAQAFVDAAFSPTSLPSPIFVIGNDIRGSQNSTHPTGWEISLELDPKQHPIFEGHRIGDQVVLPATFALTWILEALEEHVLGFRVHSFSEFQVLKGVQWKADEVLSFLLRGEVLARTEDHLEYHLQLFSNHGKAQPPRPQYRLKAQLEKAPRLPVRSSPLQEWSPSTWDVYEDGTLFHQENFRMLHQNKNREIRAHLPSVSPFDWNQWSHNRFPSLLLDAGLQAVLIQAQQQTGLPSLPLSIGSGSLPGPWHDAEFILELGEGNRVGTHQFQSEIRFLDTHRNQVAQLGAIQVTLSEQLRDQFRRGS